MHIICSISYVTYGFTWKIPSPMNFRAISRYFHILRYSIIQSYSITCLKIGMSWQSEIRPIFRLARTPMGSHFWHVTLNYTRSISHSPFSLGCPRERFLAINSGNARESVWFFAGLLKCLLHTTYKNQTPFGSTRLSNLKMVEYCEIFKIAFSKILDFRRRLKIHSKAPTRYWKGLR